MPLKDRLCPIELMSWMRASAQSGQSAQIKTAPKGAAFENLLFSYYFFLLANPTKPIRPEPNNQTAAGTGTTAAIS